MPTVELRSRGLALLRGSTIRQLSIAAADLFVYLLHDQCILLRFMLREARVKIGEIASKADGSQIGRFVIQQLLRLLHDGAEREE